MRRRLLLICAAALAAVVAVLASLPVWLGAAAGSAGGRYGLTFGRYERLGYTRFALHDVEFRRGQTKVTLSRVDADTPLVWFWHRWTNQLNTVVGDRWAVEVSRRPPDAPAPTTNRPRGWMPLRAVLRRVADGLERWLPEAKVGAGRVQWPGGELTLASATWAKRELDVAGLTYRTLRVEGRLEFPAGADELRVSLRTTEQGNSTRLESRGHDVRGEIAWWDQRATVDAQFADAGWLPRQASLRAEALNIPGPRLKIGDAYASIGGHARVDWQTDHFTADVVLRGEPVAGKKAVPPLNVNVQARGDPQAITISSLAATLPGINAQLTAPVTIERNGKFREGSARFAIEADLLKQPWFQAKGQIRGEARLVSGAAESPQVEFQFDARDVAANELSLSTMSARGRFGWPELRVLSGNMVGGEGERFEWRGAWNFRDKSLSDVLVEGQLRRRSVARWLPAQPEFDVVTLKAEASGPVRELRHTVTAQASGVKLPGLNPVVAAVEWRGQGMAIEGFTANFTAGGTTIRTAGTADRTGLQLDRFELSQGDALRLGLKERATLRWQPALQIESLHLAGPEGSIDAAVTWGEAGRIDVAASNLNPAWLDELMPPRPVKGRLTLLALTGTWDRGPLTFSFSGGAEIEMGEGHVAAVAVSARGDQDGLRVEALRATEGNATVLNATGTVPIVLRPRGQPLVHIDPDGAIAVEATAAPHAAFWEQLSSATGIELKDPQAVARFKGTWLRPEGEFQLKATRIAMDPGRFKRAIPELEQLEVKLSGDRAGIRLETFAMQVEGQAIRAQGRLPIPDGRWSEVIKQPLAQAQRGADLRLEIPGADLAAFARFLPAFVAPKGQLKVDLAYKGEAFSGAVLLRDAASRPLGPLGVLQEINADVQLAGRTFELRGVTAKSGGQPVTLKGRIEIPADGRPRFDLALEGDNLPFVRQAGLLLRGDLDLKLQTPPNGEPRISGSVRLRDSLFLSDIRSFLPEGGASAVRRPPYFAITTPPLNSWGLAVELSGDRFLRMRTPVFSGVASARFRLSGTLGEPRAIGEATVDEGHVLMPFASFEIRQGAVRLTEANPFEPTLFVRGTGRRFGYDLTMEIEGVATSPNVLLSSSPALDSEQVLLMVMTGAPPSNEITVSTTQRVTRIGTFLGQSLLGSLGADAANADRLSIATGEKISRQGKETYEIEYKLSDRLTVIGEYNEFDEHNAGIKWRVFPRKREREEAPDAAKK